MNTPSVCSRCSQPAPPRGRLLAPAVTSSPGAGEVFPQRESQAVNLVAKVLGVMRKFPAVLLPLPLGEVDLRSKDGEGENVAHIKESPKRLRAFLNHFFTGGVVTENGSCSATFCESAALRESFLLTFSGLNPLRRSRARFPLLSPAVTSSPGAGEVFPLRESQAVKLVAKALGETRNCLGVHLALPLGELSP